MNRESPNQNVGHIHQCDAEHTWVLSDLLLVILTPRRAATLTSEDKAEAVALLVEGDVHRFGNDPRVVFRSCREIEASFESLCHISVLLVDVPKAHSREPSDQPQSHSDGWFLSTLQAEEAGHWKVLISTQPSPPQTGERAWYAHEGHSRARDTERLGVSLGLLPVTPIRSLDQL